MPQTETSGMFFEGVWVFCLSLPPIQMQGLRVSQTSWHPEDESHTEHEGAQRLLSDPMEMPLWFSTACSKPPAVWEKQQNKL